MHEGKIEGKYEGKCMTNEDEVGERVEEKQTSMTFERNTDAQ